jgi:hypothetical protein
VENKFMFGLFKRKTPLEKLQEKYNKLTEEAFKLSKIDRKASDAKQAEAEEVLKQMDALN